ncbi:hypothetical protein VTN00DRAFT_534 [Thermoascus crustaceus]|uniref:uncharacterized protein n=1 Tax=Thermoascus crustaceus TaxID=5088 RepID=UPI003743FEE5
MSSRQGLRGRGADDAGAVVSDSGSSVRSVESLTLAGSTGWRSALHGVSHLLSKGLVVPHIFCAFSSAQGMPSVAMRTPLTLPASTSVRRFTSYFPISVVGSMHPTVINQTGKSPLQKTSNGRRWRFSGSRLLRKAACSGSVFACSACHASMGCPARVPWNTNEALDGDARALICQVAQRPKRITPSWRRCLLRPSPHELESQHKGR